MQARLAGGMVVVVGCAVSRGDGVGGWVHGQQGDGGVGVWSAGGWWGWGTGPTGAGAKTTVKPLYKGHLRLGK